MNMKKKLTNIFIIVFWIVLISSTSVFAQNWDKSTPEKEGVDAGVLKSIHKDIEDGRYGLIDHFLVIKNGNIIADHSYVQDYETIALEYDTTNDQYNYDHPDWHPFYKGTNLHSLQSVTKSITSALLGIAIDEGLIKSTDINPMMMFHGYDQDIDPRRLAITLHDLLTMRSGIQWNEMISYDSNENSCIMMEAADDWIQFVLSQPMKNDPGTVFNYNSGVSVLLGKLVRNATGKRIDKWAEEKLFGPLGITEYYWKETPLGEIDTEGGLYLSSHDLAKIGYLFLQDGKWGGTQIISKEWVQKSTSPIIPDISPNNNRKDRGWGYGYQWWVPLNENGTTKLFAGNGYGGQFLMVSPEHDLVVVFNGWNIHSGSELSSRMATQDRILPAIKN